MKARHSGRELPPVLHVQQYSRDQPGRLLRPMRSKRAHGLAVKMINRGQSALMMKLTHRIRRYVAEFLRNSIRPMPYWDDRPNNSRASADYPQPSQRTCMAGALASF